MFYKINCNDSQKCKERRLQLKSIEKTVNDIKENMSNSLIIRKKHDRLRG